jgi:hypothetical protein
MTVNARVLRFMVATFSSPLFWACTAMVALGGIFLFEALSPTVMTQVNAAIWLVTNLVLFFGEIALTFYVLVYGLVFNWIDLPDGEPNIGGRLIFNLTASLEGIVLLAVVQIFLVPPSGRSWYEAPVALAFWLPTARFLVYVWVVASITAMCATLIRRVVEARPLEVSVPPKKPTASVPDTPPAPH